MEEDNKRRSTRYLVDLSGIVTVSEEQIPVRLFNLSLGGALIEGLDRLVLGTQVHISFSIPTLEAPIKVESTVRWCADVGIGIQFGSLRAGEVWSLNKFFEDLSS